MTATEAKRRTRKLRLFVWENVLRDYTPGVMFALAHDSEEARRLIIAKGGSYAQADLGGEPKVYTEPVGFSVSGGA